MAKKSSQTAPTKLVVPEAIVFEYIKSNFFRVVHSDGVIGGITPEGNLHMAFFSDRSAIPKMQVYQRNSDGSLGELLNDHTVVRPGIIREMDFDVILSRDVAKTLIVWLNQNIETLEAYVRSTEQLKGKK